MLIQLKKLTRESGTYSLSIALPKIINLFLLPIYTKYLIPEEYGIVSLCMITYSLMSLVLSLGLDNATVRYYYELDAGRRKRLFGTVWLFHIFITITACASLYFFGEGLFSWVFSDVPFDPYIKTTILAVMFTIIGDIPLAIYRARRKPLNFTLLSFLRFFSDTAFTLVLIIVFSQGAIGYMRGTMLSAMFASLFYVAIMIMNASFRLDRHLLRLAILFGLPLIPHVTFTWINGYVDRIIIERYLGVAQVGIYTIAYQFCLSLTFLISSFGLAWYPFFYETTEKQDGKETISRFGTYYMLLLVFFSVVVGLYSQDGIVILTSDKYHSATSVLPYLVVGMVFHGLYHLYAPCLFYAKRVKIISISTGIAAGVNIILNILLVEPFGIAGAASATAASYFLLFLLVMLFGKRAYPISYDRKKTVKLLVAGVLTYLPGAIFTTSDLKVSMILHTALIVAFPVILLLLRFPDKKEKEALLRIMRRKHVREEE